MTVNASNPSRRLFLGGGLVIIVLLAGLLILWVVNNRQDRPGGDDDKGELVLRPSTVPQADERTKLVQRAVDKGVVFLKGKMPVPTHELKDYHLPQKTWVAGIAGLIGLTLLECEVAGDDVAVLRAAEVIREHAGEMDHIYALAASLFFLNRWNEIRPLQERDRQMARTFALRIIAGQKSNGAWGYKGVVMSPDQEAKLLASLQDGTFKATGTGTYTISNTQFAMLALWGARKHGVPVRDPLLAAASYFHSSQLPDGHWIYCPEQPDPLSASSTCAGLISLALEKALREDKEFLSLPPSAPVAAKKADIDKAFAVVGKSIGRKKGDPGGATPQFAGSLFEASAVGDLYFLWSLERLAVIYGKNQIGGKDWYDWGHKVVVNAQLEDGSWKDWSGPLPDTCFALLFLRRANIAKDLTDKLRLLSAAEPKDAATRRD
ncbi:MAG: hypothetical protein U0793_09555 [Gemmataceae bacterium]